MRALFVTAVISLASAAAAATPDALFNAGRHALRQNDAEKAVDLLEQAVEQQPNNSEYHYWLGSAYGTLAQKSNLFKQASLAKKTKNEFERAVELDPNNIDARMGLIDYYSVAPGFMGGDMDKAMQQAGEIRKRDALAGHRAFARVYARQKKPELAAKEYRDAVAEQPNSAKAHYFLALYLMGEKNYKNALEELDAAIRLDPAFMPLYFRLGQLSGMAGNNFGRGEEALKKYLTHQPSDEEPPLARAWYWLGTIYEKEGRKAEAKQSYQTALRLMPGAKDVTEALKRVS